MKALPFLSIYLLAPVIWVGIVLGGAWTWLTPVVLFIALPVLDVISGTDTGETAGEGAVTTSFNALLRGWVVVGALTHIWVLHHVTTASLSAVETAGLVLAMALVSATASVNIAHELMHRKRALDRGIAELLMQSVTYPHFCVEHVLGHHRHVATPVDSGTARLGESLYAFLPRTLVGGLKSAIRLERRRCERRAIPGYSLRNRNTRYLIGALALHGLVVAVFGPVGWLFFAAQSVGAFLLLEVINYVEHYGLKRREIAPGKYERVAPRHSWNANFRVTNWWLFNLQRHADHHANASRPYFRLRAMEGSPELPLGYPTMVLISFVPPLWRAVMDGRVQAVRHESATAGGAVVHMDGCQ
jgi:alkane 1-monooxygenase